MFSDDSLIVGCVNEGRGVQQSSGGFCWVVDIKGSREPLTGLTIQGEIVEMAQIRESCGVYINDRLGYCNDTESLQDRAEQAVFLQGSQVPDWVQKIATHVLQVLLCHVMLFTGGNIR